MTKVARGNYETCSTMVKAGLAASRVVTRIAHAKYQPHIGFQLCGEKEL